MTSARLLQTCQTALLRRLVFLLAMLWSSALPAAIPPASPFPGGQPAISPDWSAQALERFPKANEFGQAAPSENGITLTTTTRAPNPYRVDIGIPTTTPVSRGQIMLLRFAARSIKPADMTGQTQLHIYFQKLSPNWHKSVELGISLSDQWQRFDVPFKVTADYAPGEAGVSFGFGFAPQIAELADVQLLAFPASTDLASLPRTQRLAGEVDPKQYEAAIARIIEFRKALACKIGTDADIVKTPGRVLHVSAAAPDGGDGSPSRPFSTIQQAVDIVRPGDTVLVGPGVYDKYTDTQSHTRLKTSGQPDAWISIRAAPGTRPKIVSPSWKAIELNGLRYIEIRGFELAGVMSEASENSGNGISITDRSSHIRVTDNIVHGFGGGGIYSMTGDYIHIEGNVIYNTSKGSTWGNSAISLYQCINADDAPGYKNVIRRNICFDNENTLPFRFGGGSITDGNGIIIDDNRHTQNKTPDRPEPYRGWTLIENNLVYGNGGRAIHSYLSDRIDVINNTVYENQWSNDIRNGELTAISSSQMTFLNNIVIPRENLRGNADDRSKEIIFARNLYHRTDDFLAGRDPIINGSPHLAAPARDAKDPQAFRLTPGSPALAAGVPEIAPPDDLFGRPRTGPIDLGAIQGVQP